MAEEIIVGIGGEGSGEEAARVAARLAAALGAKLVLVFGYDPILLGGEVGDLRARVAQIGEEHAGALRAELLAEHSELDVEIVLVEDRPIGALLFVAEERSPRMIVVGHGGRGPLAGALLGSVTYELVHRAPVPVLVVPAGD